MEKVLLAVNGTLMRGLELNRNMIAAGAEFVREAVSAPCYRLWSIRDAYPAMMRDASKGVPIQLELWQVSAEGLMQLLEKEPAGLCLGRVELAQKKTVWGILGEACLCEGQLEITAYGGWREYMTSLPTRTGK
jgi:gamma-glutamylcyclotransferase (GGCT)/AIG2-like uncharacterized protein YtfP